MFRRAFRDRVDAGEQLAEHVARQVVEPNTVVLGLPRGGVPVAAQVANLLHMPLDVLVVRKVGVPWNPELAMGAVGPGDSIVLDEHLISRAGVTPAEVERTIATERAERNRREHEYRRGRPPISLTDRTVVIVDDGLATGASMAVAIQVVETTQPERIVMAVPVAPPSAMRRLGAQVSQAIAVMTPSSFSAVGQWYRDFSPTSDDEVRLLLDQFAGTNPDAPR